MVRKFFLTLLLLFPLFLNACGVTDCPTIQTNFQLAIKDTRADLETYEVLFNEATRLAKDIVTDNPGMSFAMMDVLVARKEFGEIPEIPQTLSCEDADLTKYNTDKAKAEKISESIEAENKKLGTIIRNLNPLANREPYSVLWEEVLEAVNAAAK